MVHLHPVGVNEELTRCPPSTRPIELPLVIEEALFHHLLKAHLLDSSSQDGCLFKLGQELTSLVV